MSNNVQSSPAGSFKGFALVRDKDGFAKFDDVFCIPKEFYPALTEGDLKKIKERRLLEIDDRIIDVTHRELILKEATKDLEIREANLNKALEKIKEAFKIAF